MRKCFFAFNAPWVIFTFAAFSYGGFNTSLAQDMSGFAQANYGGLPGVFSNPANLAQNHQRWQATLGSAEVFLANKEANFGIKGLNFGDQNALVSQMVGTGMNSLNLPFRSTLTGPSVMFETGVFSAIAITSRLRMFGAAQNMDSELFRQLLATNSIHGSLPYSGSIAGESNFSYNYFSEFGLSYGLVLLNDHTHYLKFGATVKALGGNRFGYVRLNNLDVSIETPNTNNQGAILRNTSGAIDYGFDPSNYNQLWGGLSNLINNPSIGSDFGMVYEFRPKRYHTPTKDDVLYDRDITKYQFKISLSVLDIGKVKYTRDLYRSGEFLFDIAQDEFLDLNRFQNMPLDSVRDFMFSREDLFTPNFTNNKTEYTVALPTRLQAELDFHIKKSLYLSATSVVALKRTNAKFEQVNQVGNSVQITPRWDSKHLGLSMPVTFSEFHPLQLGASVRVGPLYIGSYNLFGLLTNKTQLFHAFAGIAMGGLQHSEEYWNKRWNRKINRWRR